MSQSGTKTDSDDYCEHRFPPEGRACIYCGVLYNSIQKIPTAANPVDGLPRCQMCGKLFSSPELHPATNVCSCPTATKATTVARDAAAAEYKEIVEVKYTSEEEVSAAEIGFIRGYDQAFAARDEEVKQLHAELERKEKLCHEMWVHTMDRDWPVVKLNQEIARLREALEWTAATIANSQFRKEEAAAQNYNNLVGCIRMASDALKTGGR